MRIIESRSIDNQAGLLGSKLITGTSVIEGAFQSFIVAEDTVVTKVYNSIGIDVTGRLGLTSITLKAGAFISMPKNDYFSSIKLTSGSVVAYFVSHGGMTITAQAYLNEFLARVGSSYLEAEDCVKNHLQQLINIGLLQKASLVMSPSMYEEDLVKSVVPSDGNGDLSFTRASNGTRINSAGLVEVCPWNLLQYSEDFSNGVWVKTNTTVSTNTTTAPNGTTTADSLLETTANATHQLWERPAMVAGQTFTQSCYIKTNGRNRVQLQIFDSSALYVGALFDVVSGTIIATNGTSSIESVGNGWYRCIVSGVCPTSTTGYCVINLATDSYTQASAQDSYTGDASKGIFIWGAQLNIGSTAKPYFPTTDRLNVPRLTYQNGGGGCPSLLLEKQSTNIIPYSEQFDQWSTGYSALSPNAVTANYGTSPDGTQNADRIQLTINASNTVSQIYQLITTTATTYTASVWLKSLSGTPTVAIVDSYQTTGGYKVVTLTNEWVRYTVTFAATSTAIIPQFLLLYGTTSNSADFLAWGFQVEASSYPTSYIPTTSSSATRVADACSKTGISSLIGQSQGTIFVDFEFTGFAGVAQWIAFLKGSPGDYIGFYTNSNNIVMEVSNSSAQFLDTSVAVVVGTRYKLAMAYKANDFAYYVNGVQIAIDSSGTVPTCSEFDFNYNTSATNFANNKYNQAILFPTRLTNAELASLTTI